MLRKKFLVIFALLSNFAYSTAGQEHYISGSAPDIAVLSGAATANAFSSSVISVAQRGLDHQRCCDDPARYVVRSAQGHSLSVLAAGSDRQVIGFDESGAAIIEDRLHLLLDGELLPDDSYQLSDSALSALNVQYDPAAVTGAIQANQVGYAIGAEKYAYAGGWLGTAGPMPVSVESFEVVNSRGEVVLQGPLLLRAASDPWSGNDVYEANFTSLDVPGEYHVRIPGLGSSDTFTIAANVYRHVSRTVLRLLYHSRNSTPILAPWADPGYERAEGVPAQFDGVFHERVGRSPLGNGEVAGEYRPIARGWFDAGDYGQYIPNAAPVWFAAGLAFDLAPRNFADGHLGIPESGNGIPDLLDELEWGMDWALSMQDDDGGVYFRIASKRWDEVLPQFIHTPRLIGEKTTHATAAFAAMAAIHARLLKSYRPQRAARVLSAAEAAWNFASTKPQWPAERERYENAPGVSAGEYADDSAGDALLWAAAELFRSTGNPLYRHEYETRAPSVHLDPTGVVSFRDQGMAAVWAYLMSDGAGRDDGALAIARDAVVAGAEWRIRQAQTHPFRAAMHSEIRLTGWGSFSHSTRATLSLLQAFYLTGQERYRQWAWVMPGPQLGANPQAISYVTGLGKRTPRYPLSKLSSFDDMNAPINGIPVNGPHYHLPAIWPSTRAVNDAYLPPEKSSDGTSLGGYPVLRRYTDSDLLPPMSEPTVAEIATIGIAYGLLGETGD